MVDSGSIDGSPERARHAGALVHEIRPESFGHGRTRNLGVQIARGELLVFTSQDAVANDEHWLASLSAAARSGPEVAGAYGRQLPHDDARPPERFFLDFMYGPEPRVQRLRDDEEATFETTLFSNVNAAIPRWALERFPFRDDLTMSEDQEWSRRALRAGLLARLRAARSRPALARVHDPVGLQAVLRLGSVRRARVRRGRRVPRRAPSRGRADTPARRSPGSGAPAGGAGSPTRLRTSSGSTRASSSGFATPGCPVRSYVAWGVTRPDERRARLRRRRSPTRALRGRPARRPARRALRSSAPPARGHRRRRPPGAARSGSRRTTAPR